MAVLLTCFGIIIVCSFCYYISRFLEDKWRQGRIDNINNRYVLITGCDSGFGNAIARHLDKLGVRVFASCLTEKGEMNIKAAGSSRMVTLLLDVTNHDAISRAVHFVRKTLPDDKGLWGIANNAGVQTLYAPIEIQNVSDYEKTVAVNLFGTVFVTRAFLPLLRKSRGRVVTISSVFGFVTWPGISPYCISKYGVESFTDCIRREMYHIGVNASTIQPGAFRTSIITQEGMEEQLKRALDNTDEEVKDFYGDAFFQEFSKLYRILPSTQDPDLSPVINSTQGGDIWREMYNIGVNASTIQPGAFRTSIITPEGMEEQLKRALDNTDEEVKDFYGDAFFQEFSKLYRILPSSQDPDLSPVINSVEHALFSLHPKRRYLVGKDAHRWMYPMSLLPVWILDWFIALIPPDKAKH